MSEWVERIRGHAVWQAMDSLGGAIDGAAKREGVEAAALDSVERIRAVLALVGKRLAGADPALLSVPPLDGLSASFQNSCAEVTAYVADGDAAHLANANAQVDAALVHLPAITYPFATDDWNALRDAGVAYRESAEKQLAAVQKAASAIRAALDGERQRLVDLAQGVAVEQAKVTNLVAEFQSQFSTAQESRSSAFAEAQGGRQDKFAELIATYGQRLTDQDALFAKDREAAVRAYEARLAELNEQFGQRASDSLARIREHEGQVEKLVGVIGNLGVTSGYQKTAKSARRAMWVWQTIAVASMVALVLIAFFAFLPSVAAGFRWEGFAGRVFVALTVGVLAGYAAAQADRQAGIERRSTKLALELEAVGPYLAPLPAEKQEEFRLQLAARSFGQTDEQISRDDRSPATVIDVLLKSKEFRDFVTDIVKAARGGSS